MPHLRHSFQPVLDTVPDYSVSRDIRYPHLSWCMLFKTSLAPTNALITQHPLHAQGILWGRISKSQHQFNIKYLSPSLLRPKGGLSFLRPQPAKLFGHRLNWGINQDSRWGGGPLEACPQEEREGSQLESDTNVPGAEGNFFVQSGLKMQSLY